MLEERVIPVGNNGCCSFFRPGIEAFSGTWTGLSGCDLFFHQLQNVFVLR
jgi:hypothetical protein